MAGWPRSRRTGRTLVRKRLVRSAAARRLLQGRRPPENVARTRATHAHELHPIPRADTGVDPPAMRALEHDWRSLVESALVPDTCCRFIRRFGLLRSSRSFRHFWRKHFAGSGLITPRGCTRDSGFDYGLVIASL